MVPIYLFCTGQCTHIYDVNLFQNNFKMYSRELYILKLATHCYMINCCFFFFSNSCREQWQYRRDPFSVIVSLLSDNALQRSSGRQLWTLIIGQLARDASRTLRTWFPSLIQSLRSAERATRRTPESTHHRTTRRDAEPQDAPRFREAATSRIIPPLRAQIQRPAPTFQHSNWEQSAPDYLPYHENLAPPLPIAPTDREVANRSELIVPWSIVGRKDEHICFLSDRLSIAAWVSHKFKLLFLS